MTKTSPSTPAPRAAARMGEKQQSPKAEGIGEKQDQKRRRRQHKPEAEPIAVGLQPLPEGRLVQLRGRSKCSVGHAGLLFLPAPAGRVASREASGIVLAVRPTRLGLWPNHLSPFGEGITLTDKSASAHAPQNRSSLSTP